MTMFLGEFEHTIDEKNRIVIPSKFRTFLKEGDDRAGFFVIVNPNPEEHCLRMYTMSGWRDVVESLREQAGKSEEPARLLRFYASRGEFAQIDSQNRLVIPQKLQDAAGLKRDVILVGNIDWIEVWNVDEYRNETQRLTQTAVDRKKALWPGKQ